LNTGSLDGRLGGRPDGRILTGSFGGIDGGIVARFDRGFSGGLCVRLDSESLDGRLGGGLGGRISRRTGLHTTMMTTTSRIWGFDTRSGDLNRRLDDGGSGDGDCKGFDDSLFKFVASIDQRLLQLI
jgi:hypothetical protein